MSDYRKHCPCDSQDTHKEAPSESVLNPAVQAGSQTTLRVAGMDCADEVEAIKRALRPTIPWWSITSACSLKAIRDQSDLGQRLNQKVRE